MGPNMAVGESRQTHVHSAATFCVENGDLAVTAVSDRQTSGDGFNVCWSQNDGNFPILDSLVDGQIKEPVSHHINLTSLSTQSRLDTYDRRSNVAEIDIS